MNRAHVTGRSLRAPDDVYVGVPSDAMWRYMQARIVTDEPAEARDAVRVMREETARAVASDPTYDLAWSLHYRALLADDDVAALLDAALAQQAVVPGRSFPRLVAGVALHRLGRAEAARVAFDAAFARMDDAERDAWHRPFAMLPDSTAGRSELLARVVEAELRFGDTERGRPGVATDRGLTLLRLGPPDRVATLPPTAWHNANRANCATVSEPPTWAVTLPVPGPLEVQRTVGACLWPGDLRRPTTVWGYEGLGQAVVFRGQPQVLASGWLR